MKAVEFREVSKGFVTRDHKVVVALENISFHVEEGEFLALVGPSGCGKSTALNIVARITPPTRGEVLVRGKPPEAARFDIGYAFQQDTVLPWRRVVENIEMGLAIRNVAPAERRRRAEALVATTGLQGFENAFPAELSGGMRKRVALATMLAYDPSLLLMDEPFGALDAQTRLILQDELLRLWQQNRKTVLFVTHDIAEAIALSDRVIVMTARPARIKSEYRVPLPRPRHLSIRETPEFGRYAGEIRRVFSSLGILRDELPSGEKAGAA